MSVYRPWGLGSGIWCCFCSAALLVPVPVDAGMINADCDSKRDAMSKAKGKFHVLTVRRSALGAYQRSTGLK